MKCSKKCFVFISTKKTVDVEFLQFAAVFMKELDLIPTVRIELLIVKN